MSTHEKMADVAAKVSKTAAKVSAKAAEAAACQKAKAVKEDLTEAKDHAKKKVEEKSATLK